VEEPETIRFALWTSKYDDKNMTGRFEHNGQKYTLNVYPAKSGQAAYDVQVKVSEAGKAPPVVGRRSAPTAQRSAAMSFTPDAQESRVTPSETRKLGAHNSPYRHCQFRGCENPLAGFYGCQDHDDLNRK
jgi:hypothetical protein